jgi:hypothetical protein
MKHKSKQTEGKQAKVFGAEGDCKYNRCKIRVKSISCSYKRDLFKSSLNP